MFLICFLKSKNFNYCSLFFQKEEVKFNLLQKIEEAVLKKFWILESKLEIVKLPPLTILCFLPNFPVIFPYHTKYKKFGVLFFRFGKLLPIFNFIMVKNEKF